MWVLFNILLVFKEIIKSNYFILLYIFKKLLKVDYCVFILLYIYCFKKELNMYFENSIFYL